MNSHCLKNILLSLTFFISTISPFTLYSQKKIDGADELLPPFVLVDESATQVIKMLEDLTHKVALVAQNIPQTSINFNSRKSLTKADAIRVLESLLSMNGIGIMPLDTKFFRVVPAVEIGFQAPDILTGSTLELPPSGKVYSKIFESSYLNVTELQTILRPFLAPQAGFIILEKASAILITDSLINLQRIELLLKKIDCPTPVVEEILFYTLQHVKAKDMLQRFQNMQKTSLKRYMDGNTSFEADERTNQIIILTHSSNVALIDRLITSIDVDVAPQTRSEVFYIKHAESTKVATLLQQVISDRKANKDDKSLPSHGNNSTTQPKGAAPTPTPAPIQIDIVPLNSAGENLQFSSQVSVVADDRSNAIVASGTESDLKHIRGLIEKIDIVLAQVRIDVLIVEVTLTKDQVRGLDTFGVSMNDLDQIGLNAAGPSTSRTAPSFTYKGTLNSLTFDAVINKSQVSNNVEVLSNPSLITTHNKEATINVGESRPVITSSNTDTTGTALQSSVTFRDIGIELKVKPLISANGIVQLEITQKVENVVGTVSISNNEQPIIGKREAKSFISVADNNIIVLGGLQERLLTETKAKLTFLGQIPILGEALFSPSTTEKTNRELIIFLRPKILFNTEAASQDARLTMPEQKVSPEQIKWYETGRLNVMAIEAAEEKAKNEKPPTPKKDEK